MTGKNKEAWKNGKIAGSVVLMKKNVLDLSDFNASLLDGVHELLGHGVSFQLISSTHTDPGMSTSLSLSRSLALSSLDFLILYTVKTSLIYFVVT
jgi:linoleate 9S-lipoxygenase